VAGVSGVKRLRQTCMIILATAWLAGAHAAEPGATEAVPQTNLNKKIESLKDEVLKLNRDLFILEEDLLFPANTQFSVFLSVDAAQLFHLDSVQLRIDDKVVANYLYTERELQALKRGGVQRLYVGNLPSGKHELVAYFIGQGPNRRDYRRGTSILIDKTTDPQFVELKIVGNTTKEQPEFIVKVWE